MADVTDDEGTVRSISEAKGRPRRPRQAAPPVDPPADPDQRARHPARPGSRRTPGRPMKLTPEVIDAFVAALRTGIAIKDACAVVGVSETSVHTWRVRAEAALDDAMQTLGLHPSEDAYDADDLLQAVPEDKRILVEFLWRFTTADSIGVAELAARVHRTKDDRVAAQLLRLRRPDQFRERVEVDANIVISESKVRVRVNAALDRLAAAIPTTATEAEDDPEPPTKGRKPARPRQPAKKRQTERQGAIR